MVGTSVSGGFNSFVVTPWLCNNLLPSVELAHSRITCQFGNCKSRAHFSPGNGASLATKAVCIKHAT